MTDDDGEIATLGDIVTVRDEDRSADPGPWKVHAISGDTAILWSAYEPARHEPVADLNVVGPLGGVDDPV